MATHLLVCTRSFDLLKESTKYLYYYMSGALHDIHSGTWREPACAPGHHQEHPPLEFRAGGGLRLQGVRPLHMPADDWQVHAAQI